MNVFYPINQIIKLEDRKLSTALTKAQELKQNNYDLVIDFQGLIKTAMLARIISNKTRGFKEPREKIASIFYKEKIDVGNIMDDSMHIVERNLLLARHPEPRGRKDLKSQVMKSLAHSLRSFLRKTGRAIINNNDHD